MRRTALYGMGRVEFFAALFSVLMLAVTVANAEEIIFNGDIERDGLRLAPWGSGKCEADDENTQYFYSTEEGYKESIRIETDGFGVGGRIDLEEPKDLTPYIEAGDGGYIELRAFVVPSVYSGYPGAYQPGMYMPGMMPGGMGPGMPGMPPGVPGGEMPGMPPGMPGMPPGMGAQPGVPPGMGGMQPGMPGMPPGMGGMQPGTQPGMAPGVGAAGMPGMPPGMGGPGMPGAGMPGAGVPGQTPGMEAAYGTYTAITAKPERLTQLRVMLDTDKGLLCSPALPLDLAAVDAGGWLRLDVPMSQMAHPRGEKIQEAKLRRIILSGDAHIYYMPLGTVTVGGAGTVGGTVPGMPGGGMPGMPGAGMPGAAGLGRPGEAGLGTATVTSPEIEIVYARAEVPTFYVGQIKLLREDTPLVADAGRDKEGKVGEPVTFTAGPQIHNVQARYAWDFDDLDGISEDDLGQTVTHVFENPGYYTVTLTVTDVAGVLVPKTDTVNVRITK